MNKTIGEIAAETPAAIRIFEAWKIDYCCGGQTALADACAAAGKSVAEFNAALAATASVPPMRDWQNEPLCLIASHICATYHRYTREELDTFAPLAAKVFGVHGERRPELARVVTLVHELAVDMLPHMAKEEQILFPHVSLLEDASLGNGPVPVPFFGSVRNPVRMMMLEHERVGELLVQMREVTAGFVPPESACFSYRELYRRLAEFETKTHEHIHIENNVYFPRAVALEEASVALTV